MNLKEDNGLSQSELYKDPVITNEIKEYFIRLQKKQNEVLVDSKSNIQSVNILREYANKWNNFIAQYSPYAGLDLLNCEFDFELHCSWWNLPNCDFHSVKFYKQVSFSEANFIGYSFFNKIEFKSRYDFSRASFERRVYFSNIIFEGDTSFYKVIFKEDAHFGEMTFNGYTSFGEVSFEKRIEFVGGVFEGDLYFDSINSGLNSTISFVGTRFFKEVNFTNKESKASCNLQISDALFKDRVWFSGYDFEMLDLRRSEFERAVYFDGLSGNIREINLSRVIFYNIAIFNVSFKDLPDFSQTIFHRLPIINETWPNIIKREVTEKDEAKLRFLKDYFLKQNNHQKELEYFELEMIAKSKALKGLRWVERIVYFLYDQTSGYGNSILRPIWWLFVSWISFGNIFDKNYCLENSYSSSFARTIFPLIQVDKVFLKNDFGNVNSNFFSTLLIIQSSINLILLFLVFLGLRNKFKIK